jgi:hypothetical protein
MRGDYSAPARRPGAPCEYTYYIGSHRPVLSVSIEFGAHVGKPISRFW